MMDSRIRVNGSLLVKNLNRSVSLIGTVKSTNSARNTFTITTVDEQEVTVSSQNPLPDNLVGLVEVHGIAQGKSMVSCNYLITFHSQLAETFDPKIDNEAILLASQIRNAWDET